MRLTPIGGAQNDGLFRAETGVIYFRKFREGKGEIFRSCRTDKPGEARDRRDEFMAELWGEKKKEKKARQTVGELWAVWYQGMSATKAPKSAESIRTAWKNLRPYAENLFLDEITLTWWTNTYIPKKRAEKNPRKGIDNAERKFFNDWKWLSGMLKWAEGEGHGGADWVRPKLFDPDPETDEGVVYSDEQMSALRGNAGLRMLALIVMGEEHFMRRSEGRLLEWARVRPDQTIHLRAQDTKIREARTFPFNDRLARLFDDLLNEQRAAGIESRYVFPSLVASDEDRPMSFSEFRTEWGRCCRAAGLPEGSRFHWLRHTGLTKAFKSKAANPAVICVFAGLSLEEAMKTYVHFTVTDLREVLVT